MAKTEKKQTYREISENWKTVVLQGAVALVVGVVILAIPDLTTKVVSILLGVLLLVYGVLSFVSAYSAMKEEQPGTWLYFRGGVAVAGGIVVLAWPGLKEIGLLYILAIFAIAAGVFIGVMGLKQKWDKGFKAFAGISGLASIAFGIILISGRSSFASSMVSITGVYAIAFGLLMIVLGIGARGIEKPQK